MAMFLWFAEFIPDATGNNRCDDSGWSLKREIAENGILREKTTAVCCAAMKLKNAGTGVLDVFSGASVWWA